MINKNLLQLREKYKSLGGKIINSKKEQEEVLNELQEACNHPYIAETSAKYWPPAIFVSPKKRICEVCEYEEEGGELGDKYKLLKDEPVRQVGEKGFSKLTNIFTK